MELSAIKRVLFSLVLAASLFSLLVDARRPGGEKRGVYTPDNSRGLLLNNFLRAPSVTEREEDTSRPSRQREVIFKRIIEANQIRGLFRTLRLGGGGVDLFQGDIVATRSMRKAIRNSRHRDTIKLSRRARRARKHHRGKRAAASSDNQKWPRNTLGEVHVPYVIEASIGANARNEILSAMNHWTSNVPCIRFVQRTTEVDYVSFFAGIGCYSDVGRIGRKQRISIGPGCEYMGVVAHEIGHALGFWHEQSRPDRDQHVQIIWQNIQTGYADDFKKLDSAVVNSHGMGYDIDSLMHYGPDAFAKSPGLHTIVKRSDGSTNFGQKNGLSPNDILQAKLMYCRTNGCTHTNLDQNCPGYAAAGYCTRTDLANWMNINCKRSCQCNVCENNNASCASYASAGYCSSYRDWMSAYCRKSCNLC